MEDGKADRSPAGAWYTLPPGPPVRRHSLAELRYHAIAEKAWLFAAEQQGWVAVRLVGYHRVVMWAGSIGTERPSTLIEWSDFLRDTDNIYESVARGESALVRWGDMILLLQSTGFLTPLPAALVEPATLDHIEQWLERGVPWEVPADGPQIFIVIPLDGERS